MVRSWRETKLKRVTGCSSSSDPENSEFESVRSSHVTAPGTRGYIRAMDAEAKTEPNVKQAVPFFGVSNIEESVQYYVHGLGFEMTKNWIDEGKLRWCWLELGGAALMLQEFRAEKATTPGSPKASWARACRFVLPAKTR